MILKILIGIVALAVLILVAILVYILFMKIGIFVIGTKEYKTKVTGKRKPLTASPYTKGRKTYIALDDMAEFLEIKEDNIIVNSEDDLLNIKYAEREIKLTQDVKKFIVSAEGSIKEYKIDNDIEVMNGIIMISTDKIRDIFGLKTMVFTAKNVVLIMPN